MNPRERKYLDLSGFMFSGKHAVIELMREFSGVHVPHFEYEFSLLRVQDGVMDLENALVNDWSPVRCPAAIRRFKRLIRILGRKGTRICLGHNYDKVYAGRFTELSERYVSSLVDLSWKAFWPFEWFDYSMGEYIVRSYLNKLGLNEMVESELYLASGDGFIEKTRDYLSEILSAGVPPDMHTIVMHNAIEPYNPSKGLRYFDNAQIIVVDRDPRDNYVASVTHSPLFRKIAAAHTVEAFITRYGILRKQAKKAVDDPARVLRLQYEDLIWNYDETVARIRYFLGFDSTDHVRPRTCFIPEESSRFVGLWKNHPDRAAIARIEESLGEYCVEPV